MKQLKKQMFDIKQLKEITKFSYYFTLLKLFPVMLFIIMMLILGIRLNEINVDQALAIFLGILMLIYFTLPLMASKVLDGILAYKVRGNKVD